MSAIGEFLPLNCIDADGCFDAKSSGPIF